MVQPTSPPATVPPISIPTTDNSSYFDLCLLQRTPEGWSFSLSLSVFSISRLLCSSKSPPPLASWRKSSLGVVKTLY
ncbi:hypothetical protein LOK49_LG14G01760 [Camellia lanceoleosa]|uniref:Uncharacterized protein n=1 Tax=Camellia lanceoleosa TaxID=1840588 RepID=A0ACC0FBB1_9ERIC|nr:hypothetical protein LOK49_LG14G01760 [Camellia lanceoleosa]